MHFTSKSGWVWRYRIAGILRSGLVLFSLFSWSLVVIGGEIQFAQEVRPIFNKHCISCHGGVKRAGGISFIIRDSLIGKKPQPVIVPGKPEESVLIQRVTSTDPKKRMPPPEHAAALSAEQIEVLRRWISQGALWEPHWALVPPKAPVIPRPKGDQWCRGSLDRLILARLESAGLEPAREASRSEWMRRVSFDLTGLPPSLDDVRGFEADTGVDAHEKVVDRLLASPAFGERWATVWLDMARYADSMGFEKDSARTIWPWRDWVIRAFNQDMPFDQFTIRQLAGDLMANATLEDRIATGFHRNTQNNSEGGTDDEEYRVAAVLDRVNTTFEAWQGLTFKCAQCHAHPYEPIEHKEYFQVLSVFNQTRDWDLREEFPLIKVPQEQAEFGAAARLDLDISKLRRAEFADAQKLGVAGSDNWSGLMPVAASSTHGTRLVHRPDGEIRTEGTVAHYSRFTVELNPPAGDAPLTALRLEVSPIDASKARLTPEMGFVVSFIRLAVVTSNQPIESVEAAKPMTGEVVLSHAFGDEAEPFGDVNAVLSPDKGGWGALPRMIGKRSIVVVPAEPLKVPPGARLVVVIYHDEGPGDFAALVMTRFRLAGSTDPGWSAMVREEGFKARRKELAELNKERASIQSVEMPVISEVEPQFQRATAMFVRGNWLDKGAEVSPGVPQLYPPPGSTNRLDRLGFARWLVQEDNPLTARVAVNRFWEQLFGVGIVETLENFGSSGEAPSNPELLDHLAVRFQRDLKWDIKKLLKDIVLSATYRQEARATQEKLAKDPRNRLISRGPRTRLTAEMIRDQSLALSGLLSKKMYGRPVMPVQPEGIWRAAYSSEKWVVSPGEDRFRRAIYTYVRRTAGYPSVVAFDSPSRDVCTARRLRTNTPLQALVTLNDPAHLECAKALALRMQKEGGRTAADQIRRGLELATGAKAVGADVDALLSLYGQALDLARKSPEDTVKLDASPEVYAMTIVASTILNLDAVLTR